MPASAPAQRVAILRRMGVEETVQLFLATLDGRDGARDRLLERLRPRLVLWASAQLSPKLRGKLEPDDIAQ